MTNPNKPPVPPPSLGVLWEFNHTVGDWQKNLCYGEDTTEPAFGAAKDLAPGEEWDVTNPSRLLSPTGILPCDGVPLGLEDYGPGNCGLIVSVYGTGSTKLKDLALEIRGVGVMIGEANSFDLNNIPKVNPGVIYNTTGDDQLVSAMVPHKAPAGTLSMNYDGAGHGCLKVARHRVIVTNLTNKPKHAVVRMLVHALYPDMVIAARVSWGDRRMCGVEKDLRVRLLAFTIAFLVAAPIVWYFLALARYQMHGPTINPNSTCPGCGGNSGKLKLVTTSPHGQAVTKPDPMIEHTCNICGATWYEKPVIVAMGKAEKWIGS